MKQKQICHLVKSSLLILAALSLFELTFASCHKPTSSEKKDDLQASDASLNIDTILPLLKDDISEHADMSSGKEKAMPWPDNFKKQFAKDLARSPVFQVVQPYIAAFALLSAKDQGFYLATFNALQDGKFVIAFNYEWFEPIISLYAQKEEKKLLTDGIMSHYYYSVIWGATHEMGHVLDFQFFKWIYIEAEDIKGSPMPEFSEKEKNATKLRRNILNLSWQVKQEGEKLQYVTKYSPTDPNNNCIGETNRDCSGDPGEDFAESVAYYFTVTRYDKPELTDKQRLKQKLCSITHAMAEATQVNEDCQKCLTDGCALTSHFLFKTKTLRDSVPLDQRPQ